MSSSDITNKDEAASWEAFEKAIQEEEVKKTEKAITLPS